MNARGWSVLVALLVVGTGQGQGLPKNRVDLHGDPLPAGAIARLGTVRFRHEGAVRGMAFSHDGKLIAAASDDVSKVVLWDRATGRKVSELPVGGHSPPDQLRFSSDDKRLYIAGGYGRDLTVRVWDTKAGGGSRILTGLPSGLRSVRHGLAARELILQTEAEIVRWDIEKNEALGRYKHPTGYFFLPAAWVGGRMLVPQFEGTKLSMHDAAAGKVLWSIEATHDKGYAVLPVTFSPDGKLVATANGPGLVTVCEPVTGKIIHRLKAVGGQHSWSVTISPDARTVAASNLDGSLRLWDLATGRERARLTRIEGHTTTAVFTPDSKAFATAGPNNAHGVCLWDTATGNSIEPFVGHSSPLGCVIFSPDGKVAATSSWTRGDGIIRLWEPRTGRPLPRTFPMAGGGVHTVAFSPDGRKLAGCSWSAGNEVRVWDLGSGNELLVLTGHEAGCTGVAFSPDGKRLASSDAYYIRNGPYAGRLCIWDAESGQRLREIRTTNGAIQRVVFTPDGRHVLAAANGVHSYDAETGELDGEVLQPKSRIWGLALSPDGRLLATADGRDAVRVWELASRRPLTLAWPEGKGYDVAFAPDGRTVCASTPDGAVLVHLPSGKTTGRLKGDAGTVTRSFLSSDGRRLATASNSGSSALVWDVAGLMDRPLPAVARPDEAELRRWWGDLRDGRPEVAYAAVWRFAAAPAQAVPFLAEALRAVKAPTPAAVQRLIAELDSDEFKVRERATEELARHGDFVVDALKKAKSGDITLEQRRRIERLLEQLTGPAGGRERWRATRAVAALEQIGDAAARKVLADLAGGAADNGITREAKAAVERLKRSAK